MIAAIILAAGQSKRMGQPKLLLPWGEVTVIEHVISVFATAGVRDIVVVTGGEREKVERVVDQCASRFPVRSVLNAGFSEGDMLTSIQCGIRALTPFRPARREDEGKMAEAALIGLGDQPQVQARSVMLVMETYERTRSPLVTPSYQMRRGHPWLAARSMWEGLLEMNMDQTPRDFLIRHADKIQYVNVETPDILADLDTPDDYRASRP